jgi:hypothetical protein
MGSANIPLGEEMREIRGGGSSMLPGPASQGLCPIELDIVLLIE